MRLTKSLFILISSAAISPLVLAETSAPLTRAEVRAQLVQVENSGYDPKVNHIFYPRGRVLQGTVPSYPSNPGRSSISTQSRAQ